MHCCHCNHLQQPILLSNLGYCRNVEQNVLLFLVPHKQPVGFIFTIRMGTPDVKALGNEFLAAEEAACAACKYLQLLRTVYGECSSSNHCVVFVAGKLLV